VFRKRETEPDSAFIEIATGISATPNPQTYTDLNVQADISWCYIIKANGECDFNTSEGSTQVCATRESVDITAPAIPTNLVAQGQDSKIQVTWNPSATDGDGSDLLDLAGYTLCRISPAGQEKEITIDPELNAYCDQDVTNGTKYCYVVKAFDTTGNVSPPSNDDCAIPRGDATPTLSVELCNATVSSHDDKFRLNWTVNDGSFVQSYEISRKNALINNGDWEVLGNAASQTYDDTNVHTFFSEFVLYAYTYRVRTKYQDGTFSNYSNEVKNVTLPVFRSPFAPLTVSDFQRIVSGGNQSVQGGAFAPLCFSFLLEDVVCGKSNIQPTRWKLDIQTKHEPALQPCSTSEGSNEIFNKKPLWWDRNGFTDLYENSAASYCYDGLAVPTLYMFRVYAVYVTQNHLGQSITKQMGPIYLGFVAYTRCQ
jgi:hypothetical protein